MDARRLECPLMLLHGDNSTCNMQDTPDSDNLIQFLHQVEQNCGPCIFLLTVIPFYVIHLLFQGKELPENKNVDHTKMQRMTTTSVLLAVLSITWVLNNHSDSGILTHWQIRSYLDWAQVASYMLIPVLMKFERNRSWVNSAPYFMFWLVMLVSSFFTVCCSILQEKYTRNTIRFVLDMAYLLGVLFQFLLAVVGRNRGSRLVQPSEDTPQTIHPEENASLVSQLLVYWATSLMRKGYQGKLSEDDIPDLQKDDKCEIIYPHFDEAWRQEKLKLKNMGLLGRVKDNMQEDTKQTSSSSSSSSSKSAKRRRKLALLYTMFRAYGAKYIVFQILKCGFELFQFTSPVLLEALMKHIEKRDTEPAWKGYALVMTMFLANVSKQLVYMKFETTKSKMFKHWVTVLKVALFQKILTGSNESRRKNTAGEIQTLVGEDVERLMYSCDTLYFILVTPVQVCLALYLLYRQLEMGAFVGLAVMLCLIPFSTWVGRSIHTLHEGRTKVYLERVKSMVEILSGMKVLKLYAWEEPFIEKVKEIRRQEIANYKSMNVYYACMDVMYRCIPLLVRVTGFLSFIIMGGRLDPARAFVTASLFNILSSSFNYMSYIIPEFSQALIALDRLSDFLLAPDIEHDVVLVDTSSDSSISIENGTFTWDRSADKPTISDINMRVCPGQLVAIVGTVGSGKSSLLSAILGEMEKLDGKVTVQSSLGYVSQEPWIQNATVRDNILFGSDFQAERYQQVIKACALKDDLRILVAGDKTEIGEKGINLSGGQKQRVSLARAVYRDADIYLLDDPLSAVDAHVGKHIFHKVIGHRGMLKNKTRVLVTHGVHWLPFVDNIIVVSEGRISESGTYKQLLTHDGAFAKFLKEVLADTKEEECDKNMRQIKAEMYKRLSSINEADAPQEERNLLSKDLTGSGVVDVRECDSPCSSDDIDEDDDEGTSKKCDNKSTEDGREKCNDKAQDDDDVKKGKIIEEEKIKSGSVSLEIYKEYVRSVGVGYILVFIVIFATMMVSREFKTVWLGRWTEDPILANMSMMNTNEYWSGTWMYISVYSLSGGLEVLLAFVFTVVLHRRTYEASNLLHNRLLTRVLQMPMSFFDTTLSSRIISRFSRDMKSVDFLGGSLDGYIRSVGNIVINLLMIASIKPAVIVFILPVSLIYIYLQRYYFATSHQLQSLMSNHSAPVYAHIKETLSGTATIRAFKVQDKFSAKLEAAVDRNRKFLFMFRFVSRWFTIRVSLLSELVALATGFIVLWDNSTSASMACLVLGCSTGFVHCLSSYIHCSANAEREMVALERVLEYLSKPTEAAWEIPEAAPPPGWPQNGEISLHDLKLRYREGLDLVLHGVSCTIHSGEKVGIIGRTGAGKSSLMAALFRLVEAESGEIKIDGEQIAELGLHDLRKSITILPQDPVIFGGSLRMNLDPVNEKSSEELWEALKHSHLDVFVQSLPDKLHYECGESGKNLSVGQRQLVCLARSLLRKTKILVLDEATAAVDMETDELIQKTICSEFKDCTVLTIAHRLNTVMDYNRILVMDEGRVKEFDTPRNLLDNPNSVFYSMAKDANIVV